MQDKVEMYMSLIDAESVNKDKLKNKLEDIVKDAAFDSELTDDDFCAICLYAEIVKEFLNGS